ncbi:hypothetical protein JOL62DRAFT_570248 [Phyllosticta paracitricarpa]|uniref:Uncharacterized protein n=2 Tax=Phyllosticta TaxID=121621 RepID=A0ABR1MQM0_9PEZI
MLRQALALLAQVQAQVRRTAHPRIPGLLEALRPRFLRTVVRPTPVVLPQVLVLQVQVQAQVRRTARPRIPGHPEALRPRVLRTRRLPTLELLPQAQTQLRRTARLRIPRLLEALRPRLLRALRIPHRRAALRTRTLLLLTRRRRALVHRAMRPRAPALRQATQWPVRPFPSLHHLHHLAQHVPQPTEPSTLTLRLATSGTFCVESMPKEAT